MEILRRFASYIDRAGDYGKTVALLSLFAMAFLIAANTISRKLADAPITHVDELSRYVVAAVVFLGMPYCAKVRGHVRVELLLSRFKFDVRRILEATLMAISMVWVGGLTYAMWRIWLVDFGTKQTSGGTLNVQMWIPGIVYLIGMTLLSLQVIIEAVRTWQGKLDAEHE